MRTVNPMRLFICFKGKQLESSKAKQWKNSIHQGNSSTCVAMCTLFKMYIYNLSHHNPLQHSSIENMASAIVQNAHVQVSTCNHYCPISNYPISCLILLIDIWKLMQERAYPDQQVFPWSITVPTPEETETEVMWILFSSKTLIMIKTFPVVRTVTAALTSLVWCLSRE